MSHHEVGCDAHRRYSQFAVLDYEGQLRQQTRVDHQPGAIQAFLESLPEGTPVALEGVGNWYWIADEIEAAGCLPLHILRARRSHHLPTVLTWEEGQQLIICLSGTHLLENGYDTRHPLAPPATPSRCPAGRAGVRSACTVPQAHVGRCPHGP